MSRGTLYVATTLVLAGLLYAHQIGFGQAPMPLPPPPAIGPSSQIPQPIQTAYGSLAEAAWQILPLNLRTDLNRRSTVAIFAASTVASPIPSAERLQDLTGKIIGFVFLPNGSVRLGLKPGAYALRVDKVSRGKDPQDPAVLGTLEVAFIGEKNEPVAKRTARVWKAPKVDTPFAVVDQSVCYRFDEIVVCI